MTRTQLLLIQLAEECNEVAQRVSKALRFGLDEIQPGQVLSNTERVEEEIVDLMAVFELLMVDGVVSSVNFNKFPAKQRKVEKYLQYSQECGILEVQ